MARELATGRQMRCAIYTRKSADPPPGQEITSLESQRAICAAYVTSQEHKGWTLIERHYEDSGRTGANLNRPALRELVSDVEAGLVDIVLVYKLDRITRTLLDFVRLIDFFEKFGVVFVSITQNFDTSDSMGRLIRNILLTFAQFEREIASDRMRDKKMVMKQQGLWTGGDAPIGYDLKRGKLVVNGKEEPAVRCIFETYAQAKSMAVVHKRLLELGHRRKVWRPKCGGRKGGGPISLTSLHHILRNAVYIGEVVYRGERFAGRHQPIIARDLWDQVQQILKEREAFKPHLPRHLLTGLLFDAHGRPMHARAMRKRNWGKRYYASSYYAGWALEQRSRPSWVQADQLERLVLEALKRQLCERHVLRAVLIELGIHGSELDRVTHLGPAAALRIDALSVVQLSAALKVLLGRVEIAIDAVRLVVRGGALARFIAWDGVGFFRADDLDRRGAARMHVITIPVSVDRSRRAAWLPVEPCTPSASTPNPRLLGLLEDARIAQQLILRHRDVEVAHLAWSLGRKPASFARLVRLNYLAPDILAAIVDGAQPPGLTPKTLLETDLPTDWALQRRLLGFAARQDERFRRSAQNGKPGSTVAEEKT